MWVWTSTRLNLARARAIFGGCAMTGRAGLAAVCLLLVVGGSTVRLLGVARGSVTASGRILQPEPLCAASDFRFCVDKLDGQAAAVATSRMKRTLLVVHRLPLPERQRIIDVYRPHFSGLVYLQPRGSGSGIGSGSGSSSGGQLKMRNENEAVYECPNHLLSVYIYINMRVVWT